MGVAADSQGNIWVVNSGVINLPCPGILDITVRGGSLSLIDKRGKPVTHLGTTFRGGGLTIPWGIAVDGDDTGWVSNFARRRISQFCGIDRSKCPPGAETGDPISPDGRGYFFDGLTRSTAVEIDPSGNVWASNNWKQIPIQTNPGGFQVVVYIGAAGPLRTPVIGPPVALG
jgi:sugar lactone lactonase YvrE